MASITSYNCSKFGDTVTVILGIEDNDFTLTPEVYVDRIQIYNYKDQKYKTAARNDRKSWSFEQPIITKPKKKKDWQHRYPWEK